MQQDEVTIDINPSLVETCARCRTTSQVTRCETCANIMCGTCLSEDDNYHLELDEVVVGFVVCKYCVINAVKQCYDIHFVKKKP